MLLTSRLGLDLLVGLLWGTLVGVASFCYLQWVIKGSAGQPPTKAVLAVLNARFLNYFLSIAALAVFYKHMWVVVGTAIGLVVMLAFTIMAEYVKGRKLPYI